VHHGDALRSTLASFVLSDERKPTPSWYYWGEMMLLRLVVLVVCLGRVASQNNTAANTTNTTNSTSNSSNTTAPASSPLNATAGNASDASALQECYTNLTEAQDLVAAKDPFTKTIFTLCPNTVFDIGFNDADQYCCINGPPPMHPRRSTTIQCGDDGSSANNCTFRSGSTQVFSFSLHFNGEVKSNTAFKGITFEDAAQISLLLLTDGEFLFDDCIIQVSVIYDDDHDCIPFDKSRGFLQHDETDPDRTICFLVDLGSHQLWCRAALCYYRAKTIGRTFA
jgi:hypothetical protein